MNAQELEEIRTIVRETVRDTLRAELLKMRLSEIPFVSDDEQKDIDERYSGHKENFELGFSEKLEI